MPIIVTTMRTNGMYTVALNFRLINYPNYTNILLRKATLAMAMSVIKALKSPIPLIFYSVLSMSFQLCYIYKIFSFPTPFLVGEIILSLLKYWITTHFREKWIGNTRKSCKILFIIITSTINPIRVWFCTDWFNYFKIMILTSHFQTSCWTIFSLVLFKKLFVVVKETNFFVFFLCVYILVLMN